MTRVVNLYGSGTVQGVANTEKTTIAARTRETASNELPREAPSRRIGTSALKSWAETKLFRSSVLRRVLILEESELEPEAFLSRIGLWQRLAAEESDLAMALGRRGVE